MTFYKWSRTAADNDDADSTINWLEGQSPGSVNNSARALMAAAAKYRDDLSGMKDTGGSSTAYTVTSYQSLAALQDGFTVTVRMHATSGATPTLAVDGLTAKSIYTADSTAVATGALLIGGIYTFTYDSVDDVWYVHGKYDETTEIASGTAMLFVQTAAPTGWTKIVTHNDKALRVVSGTASNGGTVAFTTAFTSVTPSGTIGNTTLTVAQIPAHNHDIVGYMNLNNGSGTARQYLMRSIGSTDSSAIANAGGGGSHTHTWTGTAIDFDIEYVDVIIATKD